MVFTKLNWTNKKLTLLDQDFLFLSQLLSSQNNPQLASLPCIYVWEVPKLGSVYAKLLTIKLRSAGKWVLGNLVLRRKYLSEFNIYHSAKELIAPLMPLSWEEAQAPVESEVKRQGRAPVCAAADSSVCLGLYQQTQIVDFTSGCLSPPCRLCLLFLPGRADKSRIWSRLALLPGMGQGWALGCPAGSDPGLQCCWALSRATLVCKYLLSHTRSSARNRSESTLKLPALAALRLVGFSNAQLCLH